MIEEYERQCKDYERRLAEEQREMESIRKEEQSCTWHLREALGRKEACLCRANDALEHSRRLLDKEQEDRCQLEFRAEAAEELSTQLSRTMQCNDEKVEHLLRENEDLIRTVDRHQQIEQGER